IEHNLTSLHCRRIPVFVALNRPGDGTHFLRLRFGAISQLFSRHNSRHVCVSPLPDGVRPLFFAPCVLVPSAIFSPATIPATCVPCPKRSINAALPPFGTLGVSVKSSWSGEVGSTFPCRTKCG